LAYSVSAPHASAPRASASVDGGQLTREEKLVVPSANNRKLSDQAMRMTVRGVSKALYRRLAMLAVWREEDISILVNQALERYLASEEPRELAGRITPRHEHQR
jgi:hypothetical protein